MASGPLRLPSMRCSFGAGRRLARRFSRQEGQESYGRLRDPVLSRAGTNMRRWSGTDDPIGHARASEDESIESRREGHGEEGELWPYEKRKVSEDTLDVSRLVLDVRDPDSAKEIQVSSNLTPKRVQSETHVASLCYPRTLDCKSTEHANGYPHAGHRGGVDKSSRTETEPNRPVEFTLGGASLSRALRSPSRQISSQSPPRPQDDVTIVPRAATGSSGYPLFLSRDDLTSDDGNSFNGDGDGASVGTDDRADLAYRWRLYRSESELSDETTAAGDSGLGTTSEEEPDVLPGATTSSSTLRPATSKEHAARRSPSGRLSEEKRKEKGAGIQKERETEKKEGAMRANGAKTKKLPRVSDSVRKMKSGVKKFLSTT